MNYRKGVYAIIFDAEDQLLVVQKNAYKKDQWTFPGGGREEGESIEENLFRELMEELDVSESSFELIGISNRQLTYRYPKDVAKKIHGGKYVGQKQDQAVLRYIGDKEKITITEEEFKDHQWIPAYDLANHIVFLGQYQNHKKAIEEFFPGILR